MSLCLYVNDGDPLAFVKRYVHKLSDHHRGMAHIAVDNLRHKRQITNETHESLHRWVNETYPTE